MQVPLFAALGLIGIVAGTLAWRYAAPRSGRAAKSVAYGVGTVLALVTWFARDSLAYAGDGPNGPGTVIGIPFFVAFIDSTGKGGITFLTVPLALMNAAFWFLLPQVVLALHGILRARGKVRT